MVRLGRQWQSRRSRSLVLRLGPAPSGDLGEREKLSAPPRPPCLTRHQFQNELKLQVRSDPKRPKLLPRLGVALSLRSPQTGVTNTDPRMSRLWLTFQYRGASALTLCVLPVAPGILVPSRGMSPL